MRPSQGLGAGKGPKGKGRKGDVGPRGQAGRGAGAAGGGHGEGRGTGSGAPPQPDVQPVRCIPPGIPQMPAHHAHRHHHHHTHLYNIEPGAGDLIPPQPPRPPHQPAPPAAPEPQAEPARGAEGARAWDRDWDAVPDPLGSEVLPLVVEVYGRLSWASSGTTRGMRNRPFGAVLLRRDRENREVPLGCGQPRRTTRGSSGP